MSEISETIRQLLAEHGESLLENRQRLESFLRDLHYDQPRDISCAIEVLHSGVVSYFESETKRDCQLMLAQKSGLTPMAAEWAIDLWFSLWKEGVFRLEHREEEEQQQSWQGSLEDVLGRVTI